MNVALVQADALQRRASDPESSAWVSANAGSGKTHVLAQRVVRLLLSGAEPSKILCLTFTKAAAANMAERVFDRLARWTRLDDEALVADILAAGAPAPDAAGIERARKLFARVIETPGGLKIQTLHAFCERVLHLFPFEANVPAGFRPLDEREAAELREAAQARVFASAERDPRLAAAVARVAEAAGADGFGALIAETARLGEALTIHGGADAYAAKLALRLGLAPGEDEASVVRLMREGGGPEAWRRWAGALKAGSANDQKLAALLAGAAATDGEAGLEMALAAFLTEKGTPRKSLATKATSERVPEIVDALYAERDRLHVLLDKRRAAKAVARSRDLRLLAQAYEAAYVSAKAARSALDFDDLIVRTVALFEKSDAAWVLYKLDRGVAHILVDEAQDTSRAQWKILAKLAEDFLSGAGAPPSGRSLFAVGDEKQSIFSFQGAAPHLFDGMRRMFASRHEKAGRPFADVRLTFSFRSAPTVLDAVDKVFADPEVWKGVSAADPAAPPHQAIKASLPGVVEVWPTLTGEPAPEPGDWALPLDAQKQTHPAQMLAERIASVIAQWTAPGSPERIVCPKTNVPRAIRAGDILILVRSRGPLFEALTRALRRARIPTAGADRLILGRHIAVLDLCAAARVALEPDDDLALAAALKSPLVGLDDDALLRVATGRRSALVAALDAPGFEAARAKVDAWRSRAALNPFDFFARLLGADGGRRALIGRLGPEAGDAIDEFLARALAHEQSEAPSLTSFVAEIEAAEAEIKRDMEAAGEQVRVMTVHASKGLEAPIVFLPDTHAAPSGRHDPKWLRLAPLHSGAPPLHVWGGRAEEDCAAMAQGRAEAREAAAGEHRRLLYVAMTRAAQRLIVASYEGPKGKAADCWANLIAKGLSDALREAPSWWNPAQSLARLGEGPRSDAPAAAPAASPAPPPAWIDAAAPREVAYDLLAPARRVAGALTPERLARIEEGRLAHRLMQSLPDVPPERRRAAAQAFLARQGADLAPERRESLVARALALIEAPALRPLFGPGSRAEIPILATLTRDDGRAAPISGRIDRLGRDGDAVWIADFKTGAAHLRNDYIRQLALYRAAVAPIFPKSQINACLLWLDTGEFEHLPEMILNKAFRDWAAQT